MTDKKNDEYSEQEARQRLEAALRGARIAGHKPMADLVKKRSAKKAKSKKKDAK